MLTIRTPFSNTTDSFRHLSCAIHSTRDPVLTWSSRKPHALRQQRERP